MLKLNNIERMRNVEKIMPLCLALFFCRTVFIGYKYLFFLLLVPSVVYSAYWLLQKSIAKLKWSILLLPLLVIALFFAHFSPQSNVVKESVNLLLILYFVAFADLYYEGDKSESLLKWFLRLTMLAGLIAIVRFGLTTLNVHIPLSDKLFEGVGFSLVNDCNFYALFFILSIILSVWFYVNKRIDAQKLFIINIISVINISAVMSRRGYALYALLVFVLVLLSIFKYRWDRKLLTVSLTPIVFAVIGVGAILLSFNKIYNDDLSFDEKYKYYKLYTLFDEGVTFSEFDFKQRLCCQPKYDYAIGDNLFHNGDLKQGAEGWNFLPTPHDCIRFNLVATEKGDSAIRVMRGCSSGYWQVHYAGRPIIYHKDVTYNLSFSYRVLEGGEKPFNVGWWVNEGLGYRYNLPVTSCPIDSVWKRCEVSYKFINDRLNPHCFLNHLRAGSTIEVKDMSLTCDDTTGLPMYADQLPDSVIHRFFAEAGADTINYFTSPRTDRWRYALELWQTRYDTKQKIFGQGFKYLEWYGEKFYDNPKRYDFPHNPIISSFLYSGIIGGVVYIIFLIASLWLYWKRRKQLGIFFIMYLCCMFFCMFSGSSHFSFPLFAFLSFLPFVEARKDDKNGSMAVA